MSNLRDHLTRMQAIADKVSSIVDAFESGVSDEDIPADVRNAIEESSRRLEAAHERMLHQVYGHAQSDQSRRP